MRTVIRHFFAHLFFVAGLSILVGPGNARLAQANSPQPNSSQDSPASTSASLIGLWSTQDHHGVVAITRCGNRLCGRLVGVVLDHPTDAMPVDYRGHSQCGLDLITDAAEVRPGLWKGHILDPRNGDVYGAELRLDSHARLALRGYLGIPLLGQTQTWTRYHGLLARDCRLLAKTS